LQLRPELKVPYAGASGNAHLGAVAEADFVPTGANVGIVLDGMFALVDIDKPEDPVAVEWIARLDSAYTWSQTTPRQHATPEQRLVNPHGRHWLVRVTPELLNDPMIANTKIIGADGITPIGDLKVRGYLVAPGSKIKCDDGVIREYQQVNATPPVEIPEWITRYIKTRRASSTSPAASEAEVAGIPFGSHDAFLASFGAFLRTRWNFSEQALVKAIAQGIPLLQGVDAARPWTRGDLERLARSCVKLEPSMTVDAGEMVPPMWRMVDQIELASTPQGWWLRFFVPKGELVLLYGAGASGKSTWASWLAAQVTKKQGLFVVYTTEERIEKFAMRAQLMGADQSLLAYDTNPGAFKLPRDAEKLKQAIVMSGAKVVYFDSIAGHFSAEHGLHAGERGRACLSPLAEIAQTTGCTIIGVFHENKNGEYMGSTELRNVPRVLLGAKRRGDKTVLFVNKTNLDEPDHYLTFVSSTAPAINKRTGVEQHEVDDDGKDLGVKQMVVLADTPEKKTKIEGRAPGDDEYPAEVETEAQELPKDSHGKKPRRKPVA
jgi:energy-coupling factor transporter ATP-binding protein EcfA2